MYCGNDCELCVDRPKSIVKTAMGDCIAVGTVSDA